MKLEECVGKKAYRTKPLESNGDRSYMDDIDCIPPVFVREKILAGFIITGGASDVARFMRNEWDDGNWEIAKEYETVTITSYLNTNNIIIDTIKPLSDYRLIKGSERTIQVEK